MCVYSSACAYKFEHDICTCIWVHLWMIYGKCSKVSNTFLFLFSTKLLVIKNACQNSKQWRPWSDCFFRSSLIWVCIVCLCFLFPRQLVFEILEHVLYHHTKYRDITKISSLVRNNPKYRDIMKISSHVRNNTKYRNITKISSLVRNNTKYRDITKISWLVKITAFLSISFADVFLCSEWQREHWVN